MRTSVRQGLFPPPAVDRLQLPDGLGVPPRDLVGVPVQHLVRELLEAGPRRQVLDQGDLVLLLAVLAPGEHRLARLRRPAVLAVPVPVPVPAAAAAAALAL